jgi:hypothetical protein
MGMGTDRCREQYRSTMQMPQADIANRYLAAGLPSPELKNKSNPRKRLCTKQTAIHSHI